MHIFIKSLVRTLAASGVAALSLGSALAADPPTKITYIGYGGAPLNLTEQVAIEKGMFAKHGLDVTFVGVASGQQFASALMGGSAQVGVLTTSAVAPLQKQGQCFQVLTAGPRTYYNLIAQPDLPLPNANVPFPGNLIDLKGKKIAVNARGTALEYMLEAVLKQGGVNASDVTIISTGGAATAVAAFRAKQVDAAIDFPIQEQLLKPHEYKSVARLTELPSNPIYNLTQVFSGVTCAYAKANPQVVASFCAAVGEAFRYVNDPVNRDAVVGVVSKTLNVDQPTAESFWSQYNKVWPSAKVDAQSWEAQKILLPAGTTLPPYAESVSSACQSKL